MVDVVTRREVLVTRTRARIEAGKFDEAEALIDQARRLPTAQEFMLKLTQQQKTVHSGDPDVQAKIKGLFRDTEQLVRQHLDPQAVEAIRRELREARGDTGP